MEHQAYKEVYYHEYCSKCQHRKVDEHEMPCAECMNEPLNWNTHRPMRFEERGSK